MKVCGKPCKIWSRIIGYYTPVNQWNRGKAEEFDDRTPYSMEVANRRMKQQRKKEKADG